MLDTVHLDEKHDLTYRRLLDFYYSSESPIPLDVERVAIRVRCAPEVVSAVLSEFFERREDGWHQARCDHEIEKYHALCERNKGNGKKGGRPKKPSGFPVGCQSEPTENRLNSISSSPEEGGAGGRNKNLPKTDLEKRLAGIVHRKLTTRWSDKELAALKALGDVPEDDLKTLEAYYSANWPPQHGENILRTSLGTLLNNFPGEVDRAHAWASTPSTAKKPVTMSLR